MEAHDFLISIYLLTIILNTYNISEILIHKKLLLIADIMSFPEPILIEVIVLKGFIEIMMKWNLQNRCINL
jgi:hypothetical protein